ncbi:hypothetical protein KL906_002026 [Ogataea polymorpha]|uniref:Uncharacterized protein n=1 Tax=Ogataea polymorpha TaxID=460523 RepID=A0A1B7SNW4_9ASCO|nr:uncharacterized protein OGAPODRAFT_91689 [Ogataea polymorpha]KAG7910121.1 hypothetical protein KL906_002026 [Ogataea polymorpha]KAG7917821.1 hypothetical protein KL927_002564 [Ogataea polymorpha]KAG7930252.1 hypothetical protein KL934_004946 [Ogataea polymorpha]KAH3661052.1 hypothetical protein OGATHE_005384 [Ogataea polymorpha]OBA18172.1 hypothetical protein OGAPODRAFT_91689 [Ogataea polymorpha]
MSINLLADRAANSLAALNETGLEVLSRLELSNSKSPKSLLVQELFSETYSLLKPLQDKTVSSRYYRQLHRKLTKILGNFKDGLVEPQDSDLAQLQHLISIYATMALVTVTSHILLNNTLKISDDIDYYDTVLSSNVNTCLYTIQTLPVTLKRGFDSLVNEAVRKHVNSSSTENLAPSWVPQRLSPFCSNLIRWVRFLVDATSQNLRRLLLSPTSFLVEKHRKTNSLVRNFVSTVVGFPIAYSKMDVKQKRDTLDQQKYENVEKLGFLLKEMPYNFLAEQTDTVSSFIPKLAGLYLPSASGIADHTLDSSLRSLSLLFETLPQLKKQLESKYRENQEPRTLLKYWLPICAALWYGPNLAYDLVSNREAIVNWLKINLVDTTVGFWNNWIVEPFNNILRTIRHDENSRIAIMSQKSLSSDLESLERMVLEYSLDNQAYIRQGEVMSEDVAELVKREVAQGNLEIVMKGYENDLKSPLKSLILGDMIRNLLIQIQKMKVDGALAMSGIDKIIRSQELVFGFVAASPSCLIVWYMAKVVRSYLKTGYFIKFTRNTKIALRRSLNNLERLVDLELTTSESSTYFNEGLLLLELVNLRKLGLQILPVYARQDWIRDLNDLSDQNYDYNFKLMTISRIWNSYRTLIE